MGVVYYGVHRETGREVAVKVIRPNSFDGDNEMQIFLREANILAKLKHPRIVEYVHMGMQDGTMYLAMNIFQGSISPATWRRCLARGRFVW